MCRHIVCKNLYLLNNAIQRAGDVFYPLPCTAAATTKVTPTISTTAGEATIEASSAVSTTAIGTIVLHLVRLLKLHVELSLLTLEAEQFVADGADHLGGKVGLLIVDVVDALLLGHKGCGANETRKQNISA